MTIAMGGRRVAARLAAAAMLIAGALLAGLSLAFADQGLSRDLSFGHGGRVVLADVVTSGGAGIYDVRTQDDGSIIVAFRSGTAEIRRYRATGEADLDFGVGGTLAVEGDGSITAWSLSSNVEDPIVVVLSTPIEGTYELRRYAANGDADSSFGTNGAATVSFGTGRSTPSVVVSADGAIAVSANYSGWTMPSTTIARFTATGTVDLGFGDDGVAVFDGLVGTPVGVSAVGAVVLAHNDPINSTTSVVRVTESGVLDTTYGTAGFAPLHGNLMFTDAVVADDGAVTAVSRHYTGGYIVRVERLDASGSPDETFGEGGITDLGFRHLHPNHEANSNEFSWPRSVADLGDGRVGVLLNSFGTSAAAVLRSDGAPDSDFGQGGQAILSADFELLAGSMSPDGTVDFIGGVTNTRPVYLQRSIDGSPWPPVSPAPTGLSVSSATDSVGNLGLRASWSHTANPDPEVDDLGYAVELTRGDDVIREVVTGTSVEVFGLEPGVYTVTVRSLNTYGHGDGASMTVVVVGPAIDLVGRPREQVFSPAVRAACQASATQPSKLTCSR